MTIRFEIKGRKTLVTYNGKTTEHRTTWLKSLSFKDLTQLIKDGNL